MALNTIIAKTIRELDMALDVRFRVFVEEFGNMEVSEYPGGREVDSFDTLETTGIVLVTEEEEGKMPEPVGTVRILLENEDVARRNDWDYGLDIERLFCLAPYKSAGIRLAEIPRTSVLKAKRGTNALLELYRGVYQFCMRNGVTNVCGSVSTYSDNIKDAEIMNYLAGKAGLIDQTVKLEKKDSFVKTDGIKFNRFQNVAGSDEASIERAISDGQKIELPSIVRLLGGFGAKITGDPVFYAKFDRYIMPMMLQLDKIHEPAKSYFERPL